MTVSVLRERGAKVADLRFSHAVDPPPLLPSDDQSLSLRMYR